MEVNWTRVLYLHVSVDADSGVIGALQAFKSHWALLLIVDEEDDDPAWKVQQDSYRRSFTDAALRPARREQEYVFSILQLHSSITFTLRYSFSDAWLSFKLHLI